MPYGNEVYECKGMMGFETTADCPPCPPPSSVREQINTANKAILESLLTVQRMLFTLTGAETELEKDGEDKSMFDALRRLNKNAHILMNMAAELDNKLVG